MAIETQPESRDTTLDRTQIWKSRLRKALRATLPFVAAIVVVFGGFVLYHLYAPAPEPLSMDQVEEGVSKMLEAATPAPAYSAQVYDTILPSLVVIRVNDRGPREGEPARLTRISHGRASALSAAPSAAYQANDLRFAGDQEVQTGGQRQIGSGVIINADGAILTAYHVVEYAATIDITFADGSEGTAAIIAVQPDNNIAVLQPDTLPELWAPATLGNPGALRIGDEAYAVGNPFGLAGSITGGIISGLDRSYTRFVDEPPLKRLIQFDSAVNLGSSGGPLLNRKGEVVGIVVGPVNPTAQEVFIGIGFAVRIDVAGGAAGVPEL